MSGQEGDKGPSREAMQHAVMVFHAELDRWERGTGELLFHAAEEKAGISRVSARALLSTVYLDRWERIQLQFTDLKSLYENYQRRADGIADLLVKMQGSGNAET
jgi:hypothetical protein